MTTRHLKNAICRDLKAGTMSSADIATRHQVSHDDVRKATRSLHLRNRIRNHFGRWMPADDYARAHGRNAKLTNA